jgi:hypothetical protein
MSSVPLTYWTPGQEERQTRIFVSHRFGRDEALYDSVVDALRRQGHAIQDISLSDDRKVTGPRGGHLPRLEVQAEVAARIYTCDLLIAPSRPGTTRSEWVTWEVQLAAVGYGVPVLFVEEKDSRYHASLVSQIADLGLPHAVAGRTTAEIVRNAIALIGGRPQWDVRQSETDPTKRFRGPPQAARDSVLRRFPFQARLAAPDAPITPTSASFWDRLTGKGARPNEQ